MAANRVLGVEGCSRIVAEVPAACVAMMADVEDDFGKIEERKLSQLVRVADRWCGGHPLTKEQFNGNEGRARRGSLNVLVQAMKTHKVRLYGAVFQIGGRKTFMIVDADIAKKQDKANPVRLDRAKERALDVAEQLNNDNEKAGKRK